MTKPNNSIYNNNSSNNKIKREEDYFIAGPGMEADKSGEGNQHSKCMMNIAMCSQQLGASQSLSP